MGSEDIQIKNQWDVITAMAELRRMRELVIRFMEHTIQTMGRPRQIETPFGVHEDTDSDEVVHPLGGTLGQIDQCMKACYAKYGEHMYEQGQLFNTHFSKDK